MNCSTGEKTALLQGLIKPVEDLLPDRYPLRVLFFHQDIITMKSMIPNH